MTNQLHTNCTNFHVKIQITKKKNGVVNSSKSLVELTFFNGFTPFWYLFSILNFNIKVYDFRCIGYFR